MENLKKSFKLNFSCAYFCGFIGNPERSRSKKKLSAFLITTIVLLPCAASLIKYFTERNFETFIDIAAVLVGLSCLGLKIVMMTIKSKHFRLCLDQFAELESYDENEILKKFNDKMYAFVLFFTICEFAVASVYVLVSLVFGNADSFILPFPDVGNYYVHCFINIIQVYQGLASSILSGLIETIIVAFFANFYFHLKCLCLKIERLSSDEDQLKECVEYHVKLLRLFSSIEKCFNETIFIQSKAMTIILCTLAYQLTTISPMENSLLALKIFAVIGAMLSQIFMPYFLGSLVADESSQIINAAYSSKWYESDIKMGKRLVIIMSSAQKPIEMSVLGFNGMNLEEFVKV